MFLKKKKERKERSFSEGMLGKKIPWEIDEEERY